MTDARRSDDYIDNSLQRGRDDEQLAAIREAARQHPSASKEVSHEVHQQH